MIRLNNNTINEVAVTVTELATLMTPFYLFELVSDDSNYSKIFTTENVSTCKSRYDLFNVTLTDSIEDLQNGVINLKTKGYYTYNIYEQVSQTNLDLANITSLVEVGKMYFNKESLPIINEYSNQNNIRNIYNG
jgi:hypothetical protein